MIVCHKLTADVKIVKDNLCVFPPKNQKASTKKDIFLMVSQSNDSNPSAKPTFVIRNLDKEGTELKVFQVQQLDSLHKGMVQQGMATISFKIPDRQVRVILFFLNPAAESLKLFDASDAPGDFEEPFSQRRKTDDFERAAQKPGNVRGQNHQTHLAEIRYEKIQRVH